MPPSHENPRREPIYLRDDERRTLYEMIRAYEWQKEHDLQRRRWWKDAQSLLMLALTAANVAVLVAGWAH